MNIYIRQNELQNAYIGDYIEPRTPWADTIAYFPFKNDTADHSGNGVVLTMGTATPSSIGYNIQWQAQFVNSNVKTISIWVNIQTVGVNNNILLASTQNRFVWCYFKHLNSALGDKFVVFTDSSFNSYTQNAGLYIFAWYNIVCTFDTESNKTYGYRNWEKILEYSWLGYNFWAENVFYNSLNNNGGVVTTDTCFLSECIAESKARTPQEVADYYNSTKWNYGL
jgi:hypothetical protein